MQWVAYLPHMTKENFVSFHDYLDQVTGKNIDTRPAEVILKELDELEKQMKGGSGNGDGDI